MDLYFGGTEQKMWRVLLAREGVEHVSLSYIGLRRRIKDPMKFRIADHYPGQKVFLDSGAFTLNKEGSKVTLQEARELADAYYEFVLANLDAIEFASEFDARILGDDYIVGARARFWEPEVPEVKWMPVWHADSGTRALEEMADLYGRVGVLQNDTDADLTPVLRRLSGRAMLHGVAMTKMEAMAEIPWSSVGSTSWLSPVQYGDTFVWTGRELKRYPRKYKEQGRKRHRTWLTDQGFDMGKIEADDNAELLRLSVWSWKHYSASLDHKGVAAIIQDPPPGENTEQPPVEVDIRVSPPRNGELLPREGKKLLPVLGVEYQKRTDEDGNEVSEPHLTTPSSGFLRCSGCFMREKCPEARPGSDCAFEIPAKVRTVSQLNALQDWLIETQAQRVAFMRLVEQAEGGYADANLTTEIRHLAAMIKAKRESAREGFSLKIEGSATPGKAGMISQIFGRDTADRMGALPAPVDPRDVWTAEVIGEDR